MYKEHGMRGMDSTTSVLLFWFISTCSLFMGVESYRITIRRHCQLYMYIQLLSPNQHQLLKIMLERGMHPRSRIVTKPFVCFDWNFFATMWRLVCDLAYICKCFLVRQPGCLHVQPHPRGRTRVSCPLELNILFSQYH